MYYVYITKIHMYYVLFTHMYIYIYVYYMYNMNHNKVQACSLYQYSV